MRAIWKAVRWVLGEVWEKVNLPGIYRELKEQGKKHGKRFFWAALCWELVEDVVFPYLSWLFGVPELIPVFLVLHFEPIAYPAIFWGFRMYDRARGREPWEPNRSAMSSYWRSALKVAIYKTAMTGWLAVILLNLGMSPIGLGAYVGLMAAFGFIHERVWHDTNYGILPDDTVELKRVVAKSLTYRLVSVMTLFPVMRVSFSEIPWTAFAACQAAGFVVYFVLEAMWAKSGLGVSAVQAQAEK